MAVESKGAMARPPRPAAAKESLGKFRARGLTWKIPSEMVWKFELNFRALCTELRLLHFDEFGHYSSTLVSKSFSILVVIRLPE